MRAGLLDRSIVIEQVAEARDSYGDPTKTWTTYLSTRASVRPNRGREFTSPAEDAVGEADTIFRIRYRSGITTKMRIVYNSTNYDIYSVVEVGRKKDLDIYAKALYV